MTKIYIHKTNRRIKVSPWIVGYSTLFYNRFEPAADIKPKKSYKKLLTIPSIRSIMDSVIRKVTNDKARKNKDR